MSENELKPAEQPIGQFGGDCEPIWDQSDPEEMARLRAYTPRKRSMWSEWWSWFKFLFWTKKRFYRKLRRQFPNRDWDEIFASWDSEPKRSWFKDDVA